MKQSQDRVGFNLPVGASCTGFMRKKASQEKSCEAFFEFLWKMRRVKERLSVVLERPT